MINYDTHIHKHVLKTKQNQYIEYRYEQSGDMLNFECQYVKTFGKYLVGVLWPLIGSRMNKTVFSKFLL